MFLFELMVTPTRQLETTDVVSGMTTETEKITVQPVPKANATTRDKTGREFQGQRPVTGATDILTQLLLVGREDTDAAPTA